MKPQNPLSVRPTVNGSPAKRKRNLRSSPPSSHLKMSKLSSTLIIHGMASQRPLQRSCCAEAVKLSLSLSGIFSSLSCLKKWGSLPFQRQPTPKHLKLLSWKRRSESAASLSVRFRIFISFRSPTCRSRFCFAPHRERQLPWPRSSHSGLRKWRAHTASLSRIHG